MEGFIETDHTRFDEKIGGHVRNRTLRTSTVHNSRIRGCWIHWIV